jgi:hypothetical protein
VGPFYLGQWSNFLPSPLEGEGGSPGLDPGLTGEGHARSNVTLGCEGPSSPASPDLLPQGEKGKTETQEKSENAHPPGEKPAGAAVVGLLRHGRVRGLCQPVTR